MPTYETMLVLDPEMSKEQVDGFVEKVKKLLDDHGGEVLKVDQWGLNTLAYEIRKKTTGYYVLIYFEGGAELVSEMEGSLGLMEEVLRYLTVRGEGEIVAPPKREEGPEEKTAEDQELVIAKET
ncbi:MAG: 30S ribosomal protein S6 [Deltaproteobacteria bacterium]|nr:MAG: 30S ribosomal protein S6 [Deltaproteobacteria bacterium]